MSKYRFLSVATAIAVLVFTGSAFAQHSFNQTGAGTFDSNDGGNWSGGVPSANGQDVNFSQSISSGNQTVTNLFSSGGGAVNYLRLNTSGSSLLTVISTAGIDSIYGLQLNARDTLILANTSTLSHGNNAFDNTAGTLILSNGALVVVNIGANAVQNQGTITLDAGSGQTSDFNYGQSTVELNNSGTGTIIKNNVGTGSFTGTYGANNVAFANNGTIIVNAGTLSINPADAYTDDGFHNYSTGQIFVNSGATFVINRTADAWSNAGLPVNDGSIFLNGGTISLLYAGAQASDRAITNNGTISGSGTLALKVFQSSSGQTIASNGVLNLFQTVAGNQQMFTAAGGQFGAFRAVSGGTLLLGGNVASGMGGAWSVANGGTLEVAGGYGVDLGGAYIPGSALNGTIKIDSGGNMTLASAANSGPTLNQNGTFLFNGGTINMPNVAGLGLFTNSVGATFINNGNGVFRTGYGAGQNNYAILNLGTIVATNGNLALYSDDAADHGGFQNQGLVDIKSSGTLTITRSDSAWFSTGNSPTNLAGVLLEGGTLRGSNTTLGNLAGKLINASTGTLTGNGTIQGFTTIENSGGIQASGGDLNLGRVNTADAFFLVNQSGGVITGNTYDIVVQGNLTNQSGGVIAGIGNTITISNNVANAGAITLNNANLAGTSSGSLTNLASGVISGSGAIQGFASVRNSGTILANASAPLTINGSLVNFTGGIVTARNSRLVINGVFTNQAGGTLTMLNSVGTFNGVSVNSGAWITDPTTNIFNSTHIETASGYISAAAGDVYSFQSNLVNQSTNNVLWNTLNTTPGGSGASGTKFIFNGTNTVTSTGYTQLFYTAGVTLTGGFVGVPSSATETQQVSSFAAVSGFVTNFALDRLELGNAGTNSTLELADTFGTVSPNDGKVAALFVNDLDIFGSSQLIISNNVNLYFVNSNNWSSANITLLGDAGLHQLVLANNLIATVPEPSVLVLWLAGFGTLYFRRRKRRS